MRALEFTSKIRNNRILIPSRLQSDLQIKRDKDVRVIVLIDDSAIQEDLVFRNAAKSHFLEGYADSDSIYDNQ